MSRRAIGLILALWTAPLLVACVPDSDVSQLGSYSDESQVVEIQDRVLDPNPVTIQAETLVTWLNRDHDTHTLVAGRRGAPTGRFRKDLSGVGLRLAYRFNTAGTYDYYCAAHPDMNGQVIVQ